MGLRGWLGLGPAREDAELAALETQASDLRALVVAAESELAEAELEARLLGEAAARLRPGMGLQQAGETLLELLRGPLELATFFIARVDAEADLVHFPVFFEGGRIRRHAPTPYASAKGLTGKALESGSPLYVRDMVPEGIALGALLSRAEEVTGLIPQTWFGIPMGHPDAPPACLVAFQVFPRDGFSASRRAFLQRMARLLQLAASGECP
jgi:hypothetical protein